jgi:hypothetical protein
MVPNQNYIHTHVNSTLKSGECLLQFSSDFIVPAAAKSVKIKILLVLHGCETVSQTKTM